MTTYEKEGAFIYRDARPLDFARWHYHFALAAYQNKVGGFGHAKVWADYNGIK